MTRWHQSLVALVWVAVLSAGCGARADAPTTQATEYPSATLDNGKLKAEVRLPDAEKGYYRGARFDWSSILVSVETGGHKFFGPWQPKHDPLVHDSTEGLPGEFGMESPLGYKEADPNGTFIKIGIGHLGKTNEKAYFFAASYPVVKPATWDIQKGQTFIEFKQQLSDERGWGYEYIRRMELPADQNTLVIRQQLKNTGRLAIDTDYYCHNFILIDGEKTAPGHAITFPFKPKPGKAEKVAQYAKVEGKRIEFTKAIPANTALWSEITGFGATADDNGFTVSAPSGASVQFTCDLPVMKYNIYCRDLAICPEPFIKINLEPGKEMTWTSHYTFTAPAPDAK